MIDQGEYTFEEAARKFSEDDDMVLDLESEDEVEELEPIKEEDIIECFDVKTEKPSL